MENAPVTLNVASADPDLTLSQDLKKVSLNFVSGSAGNKQSKPRPFYPYHCVWGSQGLSSGRHVWEVEIQGTKDPVFVVGVATELAPGLHGQDQLWALRIFASRCEPITSSRVRENLPILLSKVGIYLDRDSGEVVFFDPDKNEHIYTFQASFIGEVFPFFGLLNLGSHITLIP
ncbi:E3 ubiquitin-protein ligase TRIM31-like [Nannospalax galili]|uniref:E3 ubiquitin-protein ligase TRIM31-like n=1 Tax=Nannospalax galili TaxID=1026970 RepID=UPI000819EDF6|nr:E3 ubiquitin-protein ligase TRIM31-like [Nannospalax galili]